MKIRRCGYCGSSDYDPHSFDNDEGCNVYQCCECGKKLWPGDFELVGEDDYTGENIIEPAGNIFG